MLRILCRAVVLVALVAVAPRVAFAQTAPIPTPTPTTPAVVPDPSDPFFSDATLQDINLTINTRDWQSLRDHFLDNT
jgi:hypothetical protein